MTHGLASISKPRHDHGGRHLPGAQLRAAPVRQHLPGVRLNSDLQDPDCGAVRGRQPLRGPHCRAHAGLPGIK